MRSLSKCTGGFSICNDKNMPNRSIFVICILFLVYHSDNYNAIVKFNYGFLRIRGENFVAVKRELVYFCGNFLVICGVLGK